MTVGMTEETCQEQRGEGNEVNMKRPLSITALSTIAVQSGQTQIVVSVLKSGSSVHLQLVHVEPGLCEIGSNQEENQTLIREQKQLLGKLQKHENEVLLSVQRKCEEQQRQRQDRWMCEERRTQEEDEKEEGVYQAMENSLREGWVLLLRMLDRRLHVLILAADFYSTVHEFSAGNELLGDLKITPDRLNHAQLTYTSIRRDLLGKSLQLLGISSDLLKKLRELQKTECLQRQGHVLQEGEEYQESSEYSWGPVRKLEQTVEALQDRRRTVDQEVKLQIQQALEQTQAQPQDQGPREQEDWGLSLDEILARNRPSTSEMKFDLELKLENANIPRKLPQVSVNTTEIEDVNFASCSDLVSMSSNETLDRNSGCILAEEEGLRVESRRGEREPTPKCEFMGTQETTNGNTSTKSLESIEEDNEEIKQEFMHEEFLNIEAVSDTELDNSSSLKNDLEIRLDQQAEDVSIQKIVANKKSMTIDMFPLKCSKKTHSDTKLELPPRPLPVFNLASLRLQPKLQVTKDWLVRSTNDSSTKSELPQDHENKNFNGESSSNCDLSTGLTSKASVVEEIDDNDKIEAKFESQSSDANRHLKECKEQASQRMHESQDGELAMNLQKDIVSKIKQLSKENLMTISDLNQESQTRLELRSRSRPIFSLVSKKLQPKLQETKDLLNIDTAETSTSSEEKQKTEATMQFSTIKRSDHDMAVEKESKVVEDIEIYEMEDNKEIYLNSCLTDQETEVKSFDRLASKENSKSEIQLIDANEMEWDAPMTKSENFSQRFKKLQSKWQEKDNYSTSHVAPKFKSEKMQSNSYKLKNVNDKTKEEITLKLEETKPTQITADVKCNIGNETVKMLPPEEPLEEHLVHKTEIRPNVDTIVKVESTMIENYKLEHSTAEQKQDEAKRILCLEEIRKLEASFDQLADKVCSWLDGCSSVLSVSSHPEPCFSEAYHSLTTHMQLQVQAQTAGDDVESMLQMLDQLRSLCPDCPGDSGVGPKFSARAEVILKDLCTVNTTIQSTLQLLQPYVIFLQTAEEVLVDFEHLKRTYADRPEVEEAAEETRWQTAVQKFLTTQELGNTYRSLLSKMMMPGLNPESADHAVMEAMACLKRAKDEVEELHRDYQRQMNKLQEDKKYCLKYRQRLEKTASDLQCVSELLDSCMVIDLGSEQHTSKLRLQFTQARPHFTQLDAEANFITANFETVRRLQQRPGLSVTEKVTEEDVSALLDLHLCFKQKVEESESILELSNSLHLLHKQLAELFQSKPVTSGQTGCAEEKFNHLKEQKEQIHNFFNRASNLKMDICDGIRNSIIPGFRVEQLESHLRSLDTQRVVWLSEAAQCEEALLREMKTQALLKDIHQLRDSFKDLKKRFGNLKVNYLKRNDRSRNIKAARNQLQQVDMYEDKLQGLISRLQTLTARVHWEQKEGGEVRELEDLLNELHRQMGECERGVREHHKTLNMTCTLQEAMDEYQFWCEEASGTISRVGKFSSDCRSSEAVSALYRQFEKFVWPTVPQQEERISQITELATRLHGAEEGRRYIEKTLSKHSEMVTAIRKLSDGLLELEARLKLESLKQQQNDEEEVMKEDKHVESNEQDTEVNQEERKNREKFKCQEQVDNRTVNEAAEMYELKETGHTPELTNKHDGREIPVRRHSFNKKPPLQKNHTQETDRQATSSFCSTHMFSLSCSPLESNRQVYAIISPSQPAIPSQPSPRKTKIEEKDTAADSLLYTELLHPHPDALSEDSLSTDEYDCPSPDDISLPPLADTPESLLLPSDLEEGLCFSSQHSYRSHAQSEHRESSEANLHSVNRVRTESGTFFPSPVTTTIRSTTTEGSSVTLALGSSNIPAQTSRTTETIPSVHTHKDKNPSQDVTFTASAHVSKEIPNLHLDNSLPKSFPVCQSSIHQGIISLEATNLSDHVHRLEDFEKSQSDPILEDVAANIKMPKCEIPSVGIPSKNESTMISYSTPLHNEDLGHNPDSQYAKSSTNGQSTDSSKGSHDKNAAAVSLASLTTTNVNETVYSQSSMTSKSSVQGVISPTSEEIWFTKSSHHQNVTEDHKSSINCKDEQIHQNEKFKKAPHPESSDNNFASSTQESDSINHLNPSCNTTTNTKQNNHQTSTQQCVHDSGFSSQLAAPPLPEAKVKALPQQANMHVTPTFTSHQLLLTPDQDPDICQPCTIREEIRLTPQIKGPSVSPHDQDECSCSTKPVSKATVMGGSPVTLEVEVTGQPEPTLTWCKDDRGEEELDAIAGNQSCEEERVLDGALCEAWLTAGANQDKNSTDDDDDEGEDRGLMAEVYDIIMADWQTWFGTLCFLLWLLFLIIV